MYQSIIEGFNLELNEDYVGLWQIPAELKKAGVSDKDLLSETLVVIKELVDKGAVVGEFREDVFYEWKINLNDVLIKIREDWQSLGKTPTIGDICWLCKS